MSTNANIIPYFTYLFGVKHYIMPDNPLLLFAVEEAKRQLMDVELQGQKNHRSGVFSDLVGVYGMTEDQAVAAAPAYYATIAATTRCSFVQEVFLSLAGGCAPSHEFDVMARDYQADISSTSRDPITRTYDDSLGASIVEDILLDVFTGLYLQRGLAKKAASGKAKEQARIYAAAACYYTTTK